MDYTIFGKYEGAFEKAEPEARQKLMEEMLFTAVNGQEENPTPFMEMQKMEAVRCDAQKQSITLRFPIQEWQLNPSGNVHGGTIATWLDMSMCLLAHILAGMRATPTVNLNIQYLNPGKRGDHLVIEVHADKLGRTLMYLSGEAVAENTGKTVATMSGVCIRR